MVRPPLPLRYSILYISTILISISIILIAIFITPSPEGFGTHTRLYLPPCLFYSVTSAMCPSCGLTTSVALLMHGEFAAAFCAHPLGPLALAIIISAAAFSVIAMIKKIPPERVFNARAFKPLLIVGLFAYIMIWIVRILK